MHAYFEGMNRHIKINDFSSLWTDFEDITGEIAHCCTIGVFAKDKYQTLPNWVIKEIIALEDCVNSVTNEQKKKMHKNSASAFTKLKARLRKFLLETGDHENFYGVQVEKYRKNPPESENDDSSSSDGDSSSGSDDSSSDSDSDKKPAVKAKKATKKDNSSSSDSSSSSNDSDSSSSSDSDTNSDDENDA